MQLDARAPEKPAGVLVDKGTNKRVPFAQWFDTESGEYTAWRATADGRDIVVDTLTGKPTTYRGKARGRLELVPLDSAEQLGPEPKKVKQTVDTAVKQEGLEDYKRLYFKVWNDFRGEANKCVSDRFADYLRKNDFLDSFVIRKS